MKTFKELRSNINEAVYRSGYGVGRDASDIGTNGEIGLYQIGDPGAISALNSFLGAFAESDLLNPIDGLVKLREKLRLSAHFDFDIDTKMFPEEGQSIDFPLTANGGSFGTTPEHDLLTQGFYEDDGIERIAGTPMVLRTTFVKNEVGMWNVDSMIVPAQTE